MQTLTFNDGNTVPALGFGTAAIGGWQQNDDYVSEVVSKAIKAGYRHIDTASLYGNERAVGKAIKQSGIAREEFFVVTKVWDNQQGYEATKQALQQSLARLEMDYVDLYLVHWPVPEQTQATWQAMEELHAEGKIKSLGLSNFRKSDMEQLLSFAHIKPVYNQLELHPFLTQQDLVAYCHSNDIIVSCWSPLGSGSWSGVDVTEKPVSNPVIQTIAKKHQVTAGQVILKWDVQQGRIVIPKAESDINIQRNLELDSFTLSADEIAQIDALNKNRRFGADPDTAYADNMAMTVPA